jgi:hypothetical protein
MPTGTLATTVTGIGSGFYSYKFDWTASTSGAVTGNAYTFSAGWLHSAKIVADTTTAPTSGYDVVIADEDGVDLLNAMGADQEATGGNYLQWSTPLFHDGTQDLDVQVSNAGDGGVGKVYVWLEVR